MKPNDPKKGPAPEVLPTLHAAHDLMSKGLDACGHPNAVYAIVVLLPSASDNAGHDVIRVAANLPPQEVSGFIQHIARAIDDTPLGGATVMSLAQAVKLMAMLKAEGPTPPKKEGSDADH